MEIKKKPEQDLRKKATMFFQIGLSVSLAIMLFAFEFAKSEKVEIAAIDQNYIDETETIEATEQTEPEPPKQDAPPELEVVEDDVEVEENKFEDQTIDQETKVEIKAVAPPPGPEKTKEPPVFFQVQKMPVFPGGDEAMKKFVYGNFNFPAEAQEVGAEGKVFIEFIVDENGKMTNIKIAKDGVGFGCGEEALRVIKLLASKYTWTPGEQLNAKVRVKYRYPIIIKLKG